MLAKTIITLCILLSFSSTCFAQEPENLAEVKHRLQYYHDSGLYESDLENVISSAKLYLRQRVQMNANTAEHKKLAIVLDIDETALSNYPAIKSLDFGGTIQSIDHRINEGIDPAIPATLKLYKLAQTLHVPIFFVTGRDEHLRAATISNLQHEGYHNWHDLYLRPPHHKKGSVAPFKATIRKKISEQGYDIVLNIGDQMSDLRGGYADRNLKLPNPFYYIP